MNQLHYSGIIVEISKDTSTYQLTGIFLSTESNPLYEYFDPVYYNNQALAILPQHSLVAVRLLFNPKNYFKIPCEYDVLPQSTECKDRDEKECYSFYCYSFIHECINY